MKINKSIFMVGLVLSFLLIQGAVNLKAWSINDVCTFSLCKKGTGDNNCFNGSVRGYAVKAQKQLSEKEAASLCQGVNSYWFAMRYKTGSKDVAIDVAKFPYLYLIEVDDLDKNSFQITEYVLNKDNYNGEYVLKFNNIAKSQNN